MNRQDIKFNRLPDGPGVYMFKKGRQILYVGKATSLKDRVKSYFGDDLIATRGPMLVDMVTKAKKVDFIETDSVLEALILEANLIKKYQPIYNTKEKSDKSFNYVGITSEPYPKVIIVRGKDFKGHSNILKNVRMFKTYGPYTSGSALKEALKIIRRIFPFLDEKSKVKGSYEFYRQIGLAPEITPPSPSPVARPRNRPRWGPPSSSPSIISDVSPPPSPSAWWTKTRRNPWAAPGSTRM